jgi:peptide/nickel transport system substrate-binding protein
MRNQNVGALAISALLLVGLLGCQPATVPLVAPTEPQAQPAATLPPAPTVPPTPQGPTSLVIVIPEDPPSFNAVISDSGYDALVMHLSLLGVAEIDPTGKVYPVLAAELPTVDNGGVVIHEDTGAMDVTWTMRSDIQWADGTPVTADDVVFTYDAIIDPNTGSWIPGLDLVTGVDKIDDYKFVVHFSSVYPSYLTLFGGRQVVIWPKHYCKAEQGFQNWDCGREPLSDGPYVLKEWMSGDHLTFARNPNYFEAGKPSIDNLVVKIVPDATVRETMLRQGDADVLMWATEQVADNLRNDPNVKVSISPTGRFVMRLFFNLAAKGSTDPVKKPNPLFSDVRVRQAIRSAIDVDKIVGSVWHGFPIPVWTEFFRPPYNTCNIARPKYDPQAADALLDQAGWITASDGIRVCQGCKTAKDGTRFKFELLTYSEYGEPLILTQQLLAEMLKAVGIEATLSQAQGSVMWADSSSGGIEQTGNFELDLYDDGYAGNDPTDFLWQYYDSASAQPDNGWNIGRWNSPQMDELLNNAYTLNETDRQAAFCQMAQLLDTELPQILLFSTVNADAYSTRVEGVEANVNNVVSWNAADWKIVK